MTRIGRWAHLYTFIAQIVLAVLMIILSLLPRGGAHTPVTLIFAGISATLALLYPMRVREERGASRLLLLAFFLLMTILILILALDVGSRHITERPPLSG
jgi:heme/copper-type cytochrome/quinol oxidase subunit 4